MPKKPSKAAPKRNPERADPARAIALLWGSHKPGRSGLTVHAIAATAIALADEHGLDALSMRHLAEALGVGTMSLYTHIPGKAELTQLMIDTVYGELYEHVDEPTDRPGGLRAALSFIAERNWQLYERHPWLLEIIDSRPVLGPNASHKYEAELRPLDGLGLTDVEMDSILALLLTHVEGTARARANAARVQRESGLTDVEWWVATAPFLDQVFDAARFPVATRVGQAAGQQHQSASDPAHAFGFGVERILDSVTLLIDGRKPKPKARGSTGS